MSSFDGSFSINQLHTHTHIYIYIYIYIYTTHTHDTHTRRLGSRGWVRKQYMFVAKQFVRLVAEGAIQGWLTEQVRGKEGKEEYMEVGREKREREREYV